jgi:hypothetical protein
MKKTTITVSFARTQSLGNYSNVKPSIVIGAELDEGDDAEAVKAQLLAEAQAFVYEAVDQALEDDEQAAKFSKEPRYRLGVTSESVWVARKGQLSREKKVEAPERVLVLLPDAMRLDDGEGRAWWSEPYGPSRHLRLAHARRAADDYLRNRGSGARLIDCADGDLSRIPAWAMSAPPEPEPEPQPEPAAYAAERADDDEEGDDDDDGE